MNEKEIEQTVDTNNQSDYEILYKMEQLENDYTREKLARKIQDDNIKLKAIDKIKDDYYKLSIAKTIKDEQIRLKSIDKIQIEYNKMKVAKTIKDENIKLQAIDKVQNNTSKVQIAITIKDDDIKLKSIDKIEDNKSKAEVGKKVKNQNKRISVIGKITNPFYQLDVLITIKSGKTRIDILKKIIDKNKTENYEILQSYKSGNLKTKQILKEIDEIMQMYGFNSDELQKRKQILQRMYAKNEDVVKKLDYRLLQTKYLDRLGEDKINLISCYPKIQEKILNLSETELDIWIKCINNYMKNVTSEEWSVVGNIILENLSTHEYDELIQDIEDIGKIDIDLLTKILQSKNIFKLNKAEQLKRYEEIKKVYTNKWINSKDLSDKRLAVLQKVFGHDIQYAMTILEKYGEDIDLLPESNIRSYVKSIREIMNCDEMELGKIYERCKEVSFVDKTFISRALKAEYGKLYNEGLLKIENCEKADESIYGENVYLAGTEFKMIIHSLGAFTEGKLTNDYEKDWNRTQIASQYFCTSYIRNDMIATATIYDICYGFDEMSENSLVLSGPNDIDSATINFIPISKKNNEKYYIPDNQINNTCWYNEMVFKRTQKANKKEPSYIVVFKRDGEIKNFEKSKKAQEDWKKAGKQLPIVIVDVDKCLQSEKAKVEELLKEYEISKTPELAKKIYYKIRNNRQTDKNFCKDIHIKELEEIFEQGIQPNMQKQGRKVTKKDLEQNYDSIPPEKRKMQRLLSEIIEIKGGKEIA